MKRKKSCLWISSKKNNTKDSYRTTRNLRFW